MVIIFKIDYFQVSYPWHDIYFLGIDARKSGTNYSPE
jgi:hypothetical protein